MLERRNRLQPWLDRFQQHPTVPQLLADKGYLSFQSGKWWGGHWKDGGFTGGMTHGDPARGGRHGDEGLKIGREGLKPVFDFKTGRAHVLTQVTNAHLVCSLLLEKTKPIL